MHSTGRLARNLDDLCSVLQGLFGKGVWVEFVKEGLVLTGEEAPLTTLLLSVRRHSRSSKAP
ncbi:hypothetical protein NCCP1664_17580 [Zafaria cholistanensis]|uniref:Uncharacterized protein n=1 Tax=Zafaria cholistanensis TaxID=1682741 RepID=A0A5A7NSW4_9MICC|nr:hypothetical protein [Zafaria cholistanensis]GER23262.1 hypothetical protein NCCP1664_17580 [Zafaria cholistanensis]